MSWRIRTIGEFIEIKHGWAFKGEYFADNGKYILLSPGNAYEYGGLKLKGEKEKYYGGDFPEEYLLQPNDMLVVMTDLMQAAPILGASLVIPEEDKFLHNQRLGLVQIKEGATVDRRFMYHIFNAPTYRDQIRATATGATVRHTSPGRICSAKVRVPDDIKEQQQVAYVLDAYDDLIAVNKRRIQLLEESARLLYREWFEQLRFPGHETVPITDGVPDGWEKKALGDFATLNYGKSLKGTTRTEGVIPVYGSSGIVGYHNQPLISGPTIIVGRKGNVGSVYYAHCPCFPIDTVYYISSNQTSYFLYLALQGLNFISSDAAIPGLNRKYASSLQIIFPSPNVFKTFEAMAAPIFEQTDVLVHWNEKLRESRDMLLPKLMSGALDVSRIALPEEVEI